MARVPLELPEGDEPLWTFITEDVITGATVKLYIKDNEAASDPSGITGTVTGTNTCTAQVTAASTSGKAGQVLFYRLVITLNSHPTTRQYGPLKVVDV
jgi:hypothetical protein